MRLKLEIGFTGEGADELFEFLEHHLRLGLAALGHHVLVVHNLRPHHAVDGGFINANFAQPIRQFILVFAAIEIGWRALQHRDVCGLFGKGRNHRRGGCT